jgi:NADH dehydrogenase FAD-containing subunit
MKVVIIGGGYGGTAVAKALDKNFDVTLLEKREWFFHNAGALRAAVDAEWLRKLFIPYDHLLKRGQVVNQRVVEATPQAVNLEDGRQLPFDYLVLATGSSYPFPAKMASDKVAESQVAVRRVNERIARAKSILLIGAGPVGIELAGEIASRYPGKLITLLDGGDRLLPTFHPELGERLYQGLRQLGVRVLFGERLVNVPAETNASGPEQPPMQTYLTQKGTEIKADVHFICFGLQLNTQYLQSQLGSTLDERNQVKVNRHLQVPGYEHIFAVGDIANTREAKLITTTSAHAKIVAVNIAHLAAGDQNLVDYQPKSAATIVVPLGTTGGAVQLPVGKKGIVLGAWAASRLTGKSFLAEQRWKALGADPGQDTMVADLEIPLPAIPAPDSRRSGVFRSRGVGSRRAP